MACYIDCSCRDCFEIAIADSTAEPALCLECEQAGCDESGALECCGTHSYSDEYDVAMFNGECRRVRFKTTEPQS
jgi:hypothetical protein